MRSELPSASDALHSTCLFPRASLTPGSTAIVCEALLKFWYSDSPCKLSYEAWVGATAGLWDEAALASCMWA